jgi:hypothetical protein
MTGWKKILAEVAWEGLKGWWTKRKAKKATEAPPGEKNG